MKNNVLPFPSLMSVPRDPPRPSLWRGVVAIILFLITAGLFGMTLWSLFM